MRDHKKVDEVKDKGKVQAKVGAKLEAKVVAKIEAKVVAGEQPKEGAKGVVVGEENFTQKLILFRTNLVMKNK